MKNERDSGQFCLCPYHPSKKIGFIFKAKDFCKAVQKGQILADYSR